MKVSTEDTKTDFKPYTLTVKVDSEKEHDILFAIFSSSKERLCDFVHKRYGPKKFSDKEIDTATDAIYNAIKNR